MSACLQLPGLTGKYAKTPRNGAALSAGQGAWLYLCGIIYVIRILTKRIAAQPMPPAYVSGVVAQDAPEAWKPDFPEFYFFNSRRRIMEQQVKLAAGKQQRKKKSLGQGMVEYIIIVAVVALGSIAVYTAFGDVLRGQVATAAGALNGETGNGREASNAAAEKAKKKDNTNRSLKNYDNQLEK
jgi:Flp pilus assembly pilin Flp